MALARHLMKNLSAVIQRTSLLTSQTGVRASANVFVPSRLKSDIVKLNQESLVQRITVNDEKELTPVTKEDINITSDVILNVNQQIAYKNHGRLFAIIHVCGKQFKITAEDLVVIEGYWAPTVGDKLILEKILLVGGNDFTIVGRPILPHGMVTIEATVIEKRMSNTKTTFRKKKRKQYMRINFNRSEYTILRINSIEITENVNVKKDVEGLERIF